MNQQARQLDDVLREAADAIDAAFRRGDSPCHDAKVGRFLEEADALRRSSPYYWRGQLGAGFAQRLFDVLVTAQGNPVRLQVAAIQAGASSSGSTFRAGIAKLRRLGLVDEGNRGQIALCQELKDGISPSTFGLPRPALLGLGRQRTPAQPLPATARAAIGRANGEFARRAKSVTNVGIATKGSVYSAATRATMVRRMQSQGTSVADLARESGISAATLHKWRMAAIETE